MDSRTMMRDDSGGGWARGKLSLWKVMSLLYCPPNIFRMTSNRKFLLEKLVQEWWWIVNYIVMEFCHFAFCFGITSHSLNETCLFFVSLLFWSQEMFSISFLTKYFDWTPTCN
jgi:hypothetical protein